MKVVLAFVLFTWVVQICKDRKQTFKVARVVKIKLFFYGLIVS